MRVHGIDPLRDQPARSRIFTGRSCTALRRRLMLHNHTLISFIMTNNASCQDQPRHHIRLMCDAGAANLRVVGTDRDGYLRSCPEPLQIHRNWQHGFVVDSGFASLVLYPMPLTRLAMFCGSKPTAACT